MSIASEISRLQTAKADLKTSINAKTDAQHQITTETIDEYADFVDSISGGSSKIIMANSGIKLGSSSFTTVPLDKLDFTGITDMSHMFDGCDKLTSVTGIDTSSVTTMNNAFHATSMLTTVQIDTSNVTDFGSIFCQAYRLNPFPNIDTSKGTDFTQSFSYMGYNGNLTTMPLLDLGSANRISSLLVGSTTLTTLGGFKDVGKAYSTTMSANYTLYTLHIGAGDYNMSPNNNLTHDSLMNVINNLYDIATKGCNTQKVVFNTTNIGKLTSAEIAIATNKGWTLV